MSSNNIEINEHLEHMLFDESEYFLTFNQQEIYLEHWIVCHLQTKALNTSKFSLLIIKMFINLKSHSLESRSKYKELKNHNNNKQKYRKIFVHTFGSIAANTLRTIKKIKRKKRARYELSNKFIKSETEMFSPPIFITSLNLWQKFFFFLFSLTSSVRFILEFCIVLFCVVICECVCVCIYFAGVHCLDDALW